MDIIVEEEGVIVQTSGLDVWVSSQEVADVTVCEVDTLHQHESLCAA